MALITIGEYGYARYARAVQWRESHYGTGTGRDRAIGDVELCGQARAAGRYGEACSFQAGVGATARSWCQTWCAA
jgi:hypothetical protein